MTNHQLRFLTKNTSRNGCIRPLNTEQQPHFRFCLVCFGTRFFVICPERQLQIMSQGDTNSIKNLWLHELKDLVSSWLFQLLTSSYLIDGRKPLFEPTVALAIPNLCQGKTFQYLQSQQCPKHQTLGTRKNALYMSSLSTCSSYNSLWKTSEKTELGNFSNASWTVKKPLAFKL